MTYHELNLPDLGLDDARIVLSMWLARRGSRVARGEPIAEILAGAATVDLPAPADGVLSETLVSADESIRVGQRLAVIESQ